VDTLLHLGLLKEPLGFSGIGLSLVLFQEVNDVRKGNLWVWVALA
jgi:hypothetical protein